jgi:hypothetical protein
MPKPEGGARELFVARPRGWSTGDNMGPGLRGCLGQRTDGGNGHEGEGNDKETAHSFDRGWRCFKTV